MVSGCIWRSLTIKTEPPGARVYVNDRLLGETPVTYDFQWYGWHRLTLRKEGFERLDDRRMLRAPIYLWIPLDLVMELLPFRVRDTRTWEYAMTPSTQLPTPVPPELVAPSRAPAAPPPAAASGAPPRAARGVQLTTSVPIRAEIDAGGAVDAPTGESHDDAR